MRKKQLPGFELTQSGKRYRAAAPGIPGCEAVAATAERAVAGLLGKLGQAVFTDGPSPQLEEALTPFGLGYLAAPQVVVPRPARGRRGTGSRASSDEKPKILQLKVTLRDVKPQIWRRLLVSSETPLERFHGILQLAMGWEDAHLHLFEANGVEYQIQHADLDYFSEFTEERGVLLGSLLAKPKDRLRYDYDFGDSWEHDVVVEKVLEPDPNARVPAVIGGARACPPEDVGGVAGYAAFLRILGNPSHAEHASMLEWAEDRTDPEAFDVSAVDRAVAKLGRSRRARR